VFGIALLLIVLFFYKTFVFNATIALVTVFLVYEIFAATKNTHNTGLISICIIFAAVFPFLSYIKYRDTVIIAYFSFMLAMFIFMLLRHNTLRLEQMSLCFMMTLLTTVSMSCIIYLRDEFLNNELKDVALFYIAFVFIAAWITDAGGYIFGRLFGRHKLSPSISPKKTVEGAVGGIVLTVVVSVLSLWCYSVYLSSSDIHAEYYYGSIVLLALLCAAVSIVGDLSASLIKRENKIKDFGKVLPGHGGMLDRFDSILFVAPLIFIWVRIFPLVSQ
jgi:phosphatidate cytidylyltransferase